MILTPLPLEKLINVNALLKGNVDIPLELIETVSSFTGNYFGLRDGAAGGCEAGPGGTIPARAITFGGWQESYLRI